MRRSLTAAVAALGAALVLVAGPGAGPASAQTPFTATGLGYPTPPVDARAAALGGVGTGLLGGSLSFRNPADLVEFEEASMGVSASPEGLTLRDGSGTQETGRSRFSVIRAVVPLGEWAASVGFASELDQDWTFRNRDTLVISSGRFPFEERRTNDGGVSAVDVSLARSIGPLSVGISGQKLTGELRQAQVRRFETSVDSAVQAPEIVRQQALWSYSSWRLRAGAAVEIADRVRIGGSYAWTDDLEAENDSLGRTRTFAMPSSWTVGASARLGGSWLLHAGGGWEGWSETTSSFRGPTRARDVTWGGAGIEFSGFSLGPIPLDLRAGGRFAELPFARQARTFASEEAVTLGLGSAVAGGRAELDFSVELGSRGELPATGTEESFTRFTFSATLHQ